MELIFNPHFLSNSSLHQLFFFLATQPAPCDIEKGFIITKDGECICPLVKGFVVDEKGKCTCPLEKGFEIDEEGNCGCPPDFFRTDNGTCELSKLFFSSSSSECVNQELNNGAFWFLFHALLNVYIV